jgi:hypothetical protein
MISYLQRLDSQYLTTSRDPYRSYLHKLQLLRSHDVPKILHRRDSREAICCRPVPTQSFLVSDPVRTNDHIFVRSKATSLF